MMDKGYRILNVFVSQNIRCGIIRKARYYAAVAWCLAPNDRLTCELYAYTVMLSSDPEKALEIVAEYENKNTNIPLSHNMLLIKYRSNLTLERKDAARKALEDLASFVAEKNKKNTT